jgi:hypothetical protein
MVVSQGICALIGNQYTAHVKQHARRKYQRKQQSVVFPAMPTQTLVVHFVGLSAIASCDARFPARSGFIRDEIDAAKPRRTSGAQ